MFSGGNRVFGVVSMRFGVMFGVVLGVSTDPYKNQSYLCLLTFVNSEGIVFRRFKYISN